MTDVPILHRSETLSEFATRFAGVSASGPAIERGAASYPALKRVVDLVACLLLAPIVVLVALVLIVLNPMLNPGPLIFSQLRMGRGCRPFRIYKFRSMLPARTVCRGPEDPVEVDRITALGAILRKTRLDETLQIINIVRGEMSLIGPRPDVFEYAAEYCRTVPNYRMRHLVRPGITGLAQVACGYAEGSAATVGKVDKDIAYITTLGWRVEIAIALRTFSVILTGHGAR